MSHYEKPDYAEYCKTTAPFYIDPVLEEQIEREVTHATETLWSRMKGIATREGLKQYIKDDPESLENLINILNISAEKFKRVITTLRAEKGYSISGEWSLPKIRAMMIDRPALMDEICELLSNGANIPKYREIIPPFHLENFIIDRSTMARLSNPDDLRRLVKNGLEGRYTNQIGDSYYKAVEAAVNKLCSKAGLTYVSKKNVPLLGRSAHFVIPNENSPEVIIDVSYNITTSSTQTNFKNSVESASSRVREHNNAGRKPIALVTVLDGAGWLGRQSDYRAIHLCTPYTLHLSTINKLENILKEYCL